MAFRLPTFNLLCNIKPLLVSGAPSPPGPPWRLVDIPCQLTYGRRVSMTQTGGTGDVGVVILTMNLLLPALTDIRGPQDKVAPDQVEVPAGSGRFYQVKGVDDIGKGFTNEHRTASLFAWPGTWMAPYP